MSSDTSGNKSGNMAGPVKKASRFGLFGPILAVAGLFLVWSLYWFFMAKSVETKLDGLEKGWVARGYSVAHAPLHVKGYPYRMYIEIKDLKILGPTQKGIESHLVLAEANAYALDKWVLLAPKGLIWHRGLVGGQDWGDVHIKGEALRASVSHLLRPVPQLALEFLNPRFRSTGSIYPFALREAERFEAYVRADPKDPDGADFLWRIEGGRGYPLIGSPHNGQDQAFDWHIEGHVNNVAQFKGMDFQQSLEHWRDHGGVASDLKASYKSQDHSLFMTSEALGLDPNNRLRGQVRFEISGQARPFIWLRQAGLVEEETETLSEKILNLPLQAQDKPAVVTLDFQNGETRYGVLRLARAPLIH